MKLVRDRIPEIIRADGKKPITHVVAGEDLVSSLKAKLVEEANEALASHNRDALTEELADILEVIDGIVHHAEIDQDQLQRMKQKKQDERGGFKEGIVLERIDR